MFASIQGNIIFIMIAIYLIGAVMPFLFKVNSKMSFITGCIPGSIAGVLGLVLGLAGLFSTDPFGVSFGHILPGVELIIQIDRLSGFFLSTICLVTFLIGLYSWEYMKIYRQENIAWWSFYYNIFVLSMVLVVTVNNAIAFLIFWEVMTLTSYFLVTFEYRSQNVRKAGFVYFVMTHLGTVFIIGAFFIMFNGFGGWGYDVLARNSISLTASEKSWVFLLALIGFGTKAGVVPLNVWLPLAHPAAPSNVSAVMSGVMIKTAIYGMIRLMIDIVGPGPTWWGGLVLTLGIISAVIGVIYALMEQDLKRLLAFSSVENIGIILMGIGTSLVFYSWAMPVPAAIALAAGLFHLFNHAIFKSLLFLATGAIYYATHTRNMEELGGLMKKMPQTALLFLIGAISISAMPLFNGFASEYQIYQSLVTISSLRVSGLWSIAGILAAVALALTGTLVAACFVKAFGISFLALPRTPKAAAAREVPLRMRFSMAPLAALCLGLGIFPQVAMNSLLGVVDQLIPGSRVPELTTYNFDLALLLLATILVLLALSRLLGTPRVRKTATWGCGIETDAAMEYSAASFSQPFRRVYRGLLQPQRKVETKGNLSPYFGYQIYFEEQVKSVLKEFLYRPLRSLTISMSKKWQCLQSGNINLYLGYVFITLVVLLVWVR